MQECSISPQTIDIDALDSLLAASLKSSDQVTRPADETPSHPRRRIARPTRFMQAAKASCPIIPRTPSTMICVPKKPDRPHSCIPASTSSRRARMLSLTSRNPQETPSENNENRTADSSARPKPLVQIVDGMECRVQVSARSGDDAQCTLHIEVATLASEDSNQTMEMTLKITEVSMYAITSKSDSNTTNRCYSLSLTQILALLGSTGTTQHLTSQAALLEAILPLLRIQNGQLCIQQQPEEQFQTANASWPTSRHLTPRPPPGRASGHRVHFQ